MTSHMTQVEKLRAGEIVNGYYVAPGMCGPGVAEVDPPWWMACWAPEPDVAKWVDFCPTFDDAIRSIESHISQRRGWVAQEALKDIRGGMV